MAEKVLKIKTLSEVAEAISGLTDLSGSLKGVGTAAFEAAGKSKAEWKALEAEMAKTTGTAKGMADQAFKVESALNAMGRAGSTSQLESSLVKAKVELNSFKAKIDEVRAAGGTIDDGMTSSLQVMEASVEAGKNKLNGLKDAASRARAELGLLGPEGNRAAAGVGAVGTASRGAATATGALSQQTTGAAKAIMAASGAVGPYGELLSQLQQSSTGTAASLAEMAFKFVAVAAAAKIGWDAGRKLDEEFKKMGIDLAEPESMLRKLEAALRQTPEAADDASVSIVEVVSGTAALEKGIAALEKGIANIPGPLKEFALGLIDVAKGAREAEPAFKNLAVDIDLVDERLTEHTKGLAGQIVARRALLNEVQKTAGAFKDALPGWQSTAERAKDLADQIRAVDVTFRSFEKTGVDLRKEIEANPVPLQKFIEVVKEGKVSFDELPPSIQKAIAILKEIQPTAEGAATGILSLKDALEGLGKGDVASSIEAVAQALKLISLSGGDVGAAAAGNIDGLMKLRTAAEGSYETLQKFRTEVMDQLPAYQATAIASQKYAGTLEEITAQTAAYEAQRRAANEADIEASIRMHEFEANAQKMARGIDTIGEAWAKATGQAAGFTVEVRRATKTVEEADPAFTAFIESLAGVSDQYERMIPYVGKLIADLEAGRISTDEFGKAIDQMRVSFMQIQGVSGQMFGDIESLFNRLRALTNEFTHGQNPRNKR